VVGRGFSRIPGKCFGKFNQIPLTILASAKIRELEVTLEAVSESSLPTMTSMVSTLPPSAFPSEE
jgi:hypothetical protein